MASEKSPRPAVPSGGLALLLTEEERLDRELSAARERGAAVVARAREAANRLRAGLDDELAAARLASEREGAAELARRRLELEASTAATVSRLERLDDAEVVRLAAWLVDLTIAEDRSR